MCVRWEEILLDTGHWKGRLLRMVASFPVTLAEVIIQGSKCARRRTPRPGRVVCGARACCVKFMAGAPLGWDGGDLAVLVWWFWCRQCLVTVTCRDLSTRHAGLTQCAARVTGILAKPDFYCRLLSNAVVTQTSLHEIIFGPRVEDIYLSTCTPKYRRTSVSTNSVTCHSHRHRDPSPPTLDTDTSSGTGALQKKKLAKYVAVDRLLLQKAHPGV
jgi:hypothetical protein